ncbi:MAG: nitroreductase family protein [Chloroflexi bacterium]|nr:nitroreductase family protein [Chloroflexota bacterium]
MKYDELLELLRYRRSIRVFKPDPIPDESIMKILDAAHYAMSGGNSQPWEFIVVKDAKIKEGIFNAYLANFELTYHLEQQRAPRYRHPAFNVPPEEKDKARQMVCGWKDAPVYIMVVEDGRKMFGSVLAARSDLNGESLSVFASSMGHVSMILHLAAAALGLGSQRVDVCTQESYRQILKYPEPSRLSFIVPVGYRAYQPGPPHRLPLKSLVHFDQYDTSKAIRDDNFLEYLDKIRALGRLGYEDETAARKKL